MNVELLFECRLRLVTFHRPIRAKEARRTCRILTTRDRHWEWYIPLWYAPFRLASSPWASRDPYNALAMQLCHSRWVYWDAIRSSSWRVCRRARLLSPIAVWTRRDVYVSRHSAVRSRHVDIDPVRVSSLSRPIELTFGRRSEVAGRSRGSAVRCVGLRCSRGFGLRGLLRHPRFRQQDPLERWFIELFWFFFQFNTNIYKMHSLSIIYNCLYKIY